MAIGETLSSARMARGLTVDDVAYAIRVRATVVRAMEADDFGPCGGAVYARGHLRNIAGVLGLDAVPLVAEFDHEHGWSPSPLTMPGLDRATAARVERHRPNWTAATAAALVVVCVVAGVQLLRSSGGPPRTPVTAPGLTGSATTSTRPSLPSSERPSPTPSDVLALVDPNVVTVQVRITGDKSWVSITDSTRTMLFQGVLGAGTTRVFRDPKQLRLTIGNAGAVDLVVNGRDLGPPGPPGAVTHVVFNQGDPLAGSAG